MRLTLATRHANPDFMPLALLYLKAALVEHGGLAADGVQIAEFGRAASGEEIASQLLAGEPDVIGLSCYVWNGRALLEAARRIKAERPHIRIVLGGPEVGPVADDVLAKHPYVDAVVRSEGEVPICDLVGAWREGRSLGGIPGISFRADGAVTANPEAPIVRDLNRVASPHLANYLDHTKRVICLETQRGCVFTCNFCFYNKDYSIRNRRFDLPRVKEEIRYWLEQDVRQIFLMDPVFNLNSERAKEICRFIVEHNHRRVPFHTEVWAEFIDDEMAQLFAAANFAFIEVGLQTSDHAVLEIVERRFKRQQFIEGIGFLKKHELKFELQLIAGLPGETLETFRRSLDFAATLDPPQLAAFNLMILPGTELWRKADALHIAFDPDPPYHVRSHETLDAPAMVQIADIAQTAETLWKSPTLHFLARTDGARLSDLVDAWLAWHERPPERDALASLLPAFVARYCASRGVAAAFFQASAELECRKAAEVALGAMGSEIHASG